MKTIPKWIIYGVFAVATLIYFQSRFGLKTANPTNVEWIMANYSDWTPDYLAWKYYRYQPWSFPLGIMEGYSQPQKVSIGLTGAIPLIAVPMKLFSGALPDDFQYHGIWLLLCYFLQGVFAYHLLRHFTKDQLYSTIGAILFIFSYSLLDRLGHLNLCAHWIVLAGLYVYFADFSHKRKILYHSLIVFATIWIHPYLILFTVGFTALTFLEEWWSKKINFKSFLTAGGITGLAAVLSWGLIGNFVLGGSDSQAGGFGIFSTNLNTFWNPKVDTPFLTHAPDYTDGQFEGIAYLGVGVLLLLFVVLLLQILGKIKFNWNKKNGLMAALGIIFFLFSLSHEISYGDQLLFAIPFSKTIIKIFAVFRASGRYIWLLQYLLMFFAIVGLYKISIDAKIKMAILSFVVMINLFDFNHFFKRSIIFDHYFEPIENFNKEAFEKVIESSDEVIMYPPHSRQYLTGYDETPLISIAATHQKPINTGHLARVDAKLRSTYFKKLVSDISANPERFLKNCIISTPKDAEVFQPLMDKGMFEIFMINGFLVYVPSSNDAVLNSLKSKSTIDSIPYKREGFEDFQLRNSKHNWLISVMDDAGTYLDQCSEITRYFDRIDSKFSDLKFRESYIGIIQRDTLLTEIFGRDSENGLLNIKQSINGIEVEVNSASMDYGNLCNIIINGKEQSKGVRGINIVVIDDQGELVESTFFDTYKECHHYSDYVERKFPVWKIN